MSISFLGRYHHFSQLASIILQYIPFMRLYFTYCNDFETNSKLLARFRSKNGLINNFLRSAEENPELRGNTLSSLLIIPVQRICKYPLFFKDLMKYTSSPHPDLIFLQQCVEKFIELNLENNEKMGILLKKTRLFQLQGFLEEIAREREENFCWNLNLLENGRELLAEENLEVIVNDKPVGCKAWFLNDLIIVMQSNEILG